MLTDKKITELAEMLEKGEVSSVEIAKAYIERIDTINGKINAYITVDKDILLEEAKKSDERRAGGAARSRYDGIPIAIKDNINTEGLRTTCGSKILHNYISPYNAGSYENLRSQGFLPLGKTNMDEFAMGSTTESSHFGAAKNPFDPEKVPGGSSGGSAAAVAAMMAPGSLGSDTGGSIRQPAAFCGVVGIKPTYGRVSRYGLVAFASSLDQVGTFGRSVDDAALLLAAISGWDKRDSTSIEKEIDFTPEDLNDDISGMVIGVPDEYFQGVSPEIKDTIEKKIQDLEAQGARVEKISLKYTDYAIPVYYMIATAEASSNLARFDGIRYGYRPEGVSDLTSLYEKTREEGFGKEVKRRIILGTYALSAGYYDAYYLQALKGRTLIIEDFKDAFSKVDAIVSPVTTTTAFKMGEMLSDPLQMYMSDILTISANLAGIPGISIPVGKDSSGMPIGLQVMGSHFQEKTILSLARAVEKTCEPIKPVI
ncbi:MAG: Asp-tRNA(Asn)/Glu-tRNA(Gln) amidotransferase subunit GatA [bacterium]|nr:Asp-tRNA(Asn)/Glu-tRNA(Gln) amidotransferase subunit GatA [bacterium]